jgi:fatty acid desaturase
MTNRITTRAVPAPGAAAAAGAATTAEFDAQKVDVEAFLADLRELRRGIDTTLGARDFAHLRRLEKIGRAATLIGLATAWIAPNPLSMAALSFGRSARWLFMHHVGHRGYDKVPGVPRRYTSKGFARGARRFLDWPDWMIPEAWIYEHNVLHHSHVGEERDPDLIERNTQWLRGSRLPRSIKYAVMFLLGISWRAVYYAPNTLRVWRGRFRETTADASEATHGRNPEGHARELWRRCLLPYAALEFVGLPALFLPLGTWAAASVLINSLGAEALTNLHTFLVVGPNHSGDDLYRFSTPPSSPGESMLRQVVGSTNYACGDELTDTLHLYLNYQIEHHLWPDLPMLRYREVQPQVKALCEKHGIPYVQESVFRRARKMLDIAVGKTSMKSSPGLLARRPRRHASAVAVAGAENAGSPQTATLP